jgi:hypothetical protein
MLFVVFLIAEASGSIPFHSETGSPFNEATRFAIEVTTDHDHERHFKALFSTGASDSWLERGAMSPMSHREYQERESIGAAEREEPSYTLVGGRLEQVVPWEVKHEHHSTFRHGAGQLGAGLDSTFVRDFKEYTISPGPTRFALEIGPIDASLGWSESPVIPDETGRWMVEGSVDIHGLGEIPVPVSFDTSHRGISLPTDLYHHFTDLIKALDGSVSNFLDVLSVKVPCDLIPAISVTIGGVCTQLAVAQQIVIPEPGCFVWVHHNTEGTFVGVGEVFFEKRSVHFDSLKRVVSVSV